jgi:hypothetical protein
MRPTHRLLNIIHSSPSYTDTASALSDLLEYACRLGEAGESSTTKPTHAVSVFIRSVVPCCSTDQQLELLA